MTERHIRMAQLVGMEIARAAGRPVAARPSRPAPGSRPAATFGTAQWAQDLLGLTDAQARSPIFIQAAWKARLQSCHPDAGGSDGAAQEAGFARDLLLARLEP